MIQPYSIPDPFIREGENPSARALCEVAKAANRVASIPDSFISSVLSLQAPGVRNSGSTTSTSIVIDRVLIDDDISGSVEVEGIYLTESDVEVESGVGVEFQDPPDTVIEKLLLDCYEPCQVELKFFRDVVTEGEPGDIPGSDSTTIRRVLATEVDESRSSSDTQVIKYATKTYFYEDGVDFEVGEYERADYPDYPEDEDFPPEGLPEGFLKRRWRGIAINNVLIISLCKLLPPRPLPEV